METLPRVASPSKGAPALSCEKRHYKHRKKEMNSLSAVHNY